MLKIKSYDDYLDSVREQYLKLSTIESLQRRLQSLKEMKQDLENEARNAVYGGISQREGSLKLQRISGRLIAIQKELENREQQQGVAKKVRNSKPTL